MSNDKLRTKLKKLFDTQVVVRKLGKNRIKVVDTSRLQSDGGNTHSVYGGRFSGLHTSRTRGFNPHNQTLNFHSSKLMLFTDYEAMDTDPIIASALDIYSDESTVSFPDGDVLRISSKDDNIKKILRNLYYDILNIDYNLWSWVRNMCKYGDFYLFLDLEEGLGIRNVIPLSSYDMRRVEGEYIENPYEVYFKYEGNLPLGLLQGKDSETLEGRGYRDREKRLENFEVAHFRLLTDTNFLPYGRSQIEPARKIFKMLILMEDAMLIYRITRAPERRLFKVDVGNIPPNEVDNYMEKIINQSKKIPYVNQSTGDYNLKYNVDNQMEDYYIPVRGKESGTDISTLPGLSNDGYMDDIEYVKEKMMAALKIPKAWLGYDQHVEGKSVLAAEDIRFARTIERVQKIVLSELKKIGIIHLYSQGYSDNELINFNLELNTPSVVYKRQQIELLSEQINLAVEMSKSNMFSNKYIYENVFDLSETEWLEEQDRIVQDLANKFRFAQIETEGNDPTVSGMSFGTPHDLLSMQMASKANDERDGFDPFNPPSEGEEMRGRPKKLGSIGTHSDPSGRDPLGDRDMKADAGRLDDEPLDHKFKDGGPLSTKESYSSLIQQLSSHLGTKKGVISELYKKDKELKEEHPLLNEDYVIKNVEN